MAATVSAPAETLESVIARVREIGPILRENVLDGERDRCLPAASFEAMREAGLFRLGKPAAYGGYELDPVSLLKICEEVAVYDTAAGWNLQITTAIALLFAWFGDEGVGDIHRADPDATVAGALFPPGKLTAVEGGYRLSGRWPFASGSQQAKWCFGPSFLLDGDTLRTYEDGTPQQALVVFSAADVEILDTWRTLGMRGTGSQDVIAENVFVPAHHAAPLVPLSELDPAYSHPGYRMAMWTAIALLAPPALAAARNAVEALIELAQTKKPSYTTTTLRDRSVVQASVAKARARLDSARCYLYQSLDEGYDTARRGDALSLEQKGKIQLATSYAVRSAADAVDLVCESAGSSAIRLEKPFERRFRDVHTMTQHAAASTARYESVGQVLFGLEPDWPFFAL